MRYAEDLDFTVSRGDSCTGTGFCRQSMRKKNTQYIHMGTFQAVSYTHLNTAGRLLREVNRTWDTSNLFIFPITSAMTKHKTRKQIENGIGKYLIYKGVPIIDFYSHNNF